MTTGHSNRSGPTRGKGPARAGGGAEGAGPRRGQAGPGRPSQRLGWGWGARKVASRLSPNRTRIMSRLRKLKHEGNRTKTPHHQVAAGPPGQNAAVTGEKTHHTQKVTRGTMAGPVLNNGTQRTRRWCPLRANRETRASRGPRCNSSVFQNRGQRLCSHTQKRGEFVTGDSC